MMVVNDILHPTPYFLRHDLAMLQAEPVRDPSLINQHCRFPFVLGGETCCLLQRRSIPAGLYEIIARLPRDPGVVLAPEEDEVGVDGVFAVGARIGGGAPDLLAPLVVGDHVHFVLGEEEHLFDADGGFDERGGGAGGVLGEPHDETDEVVDDVGGDEVHEGFDDRAGYMRGTGDAEER